ncbi:MAG TPA: cyclic nucleotide-binding domain-containing protein [Nocardioidaceae bacterium]|nr:cyclic nucleotide-binding domain-containing protein [Nocardioidaceae bacterium]
MAADPAIVKELGATDLFGSVGRKALEAIASQARVVEHAPGKEITEEGGSATGFHLIRSGSATVHVGGTPRPSLGPGQYFGEISLIDGHPRSATVTADGPLTTISLASWSFKPILDEEPGVARSLLVVMCERLRAAEHR